MYLIFLILSIWLGGSISEPAPTPVPLCYNSNGTITHCTELAKPERAKRR